MDNKAKLIKGLVKQKVAPKATFGTDPNDPWSVRANITEDALLDKFLNSRGINPKFVSKDTKDAHSKTGEFQKWKQDHLGIRVEGMSTTQSPTALRKKALEKSEKAHKEVHSNGDLIRSEGVIKDVKRWVAGKDASSRQGVEIGKMMTAQHGGDKEAANKHFNRYKRLNKLTKEETDKEDTITLDIPLMIRVLEYAREDAKDDMALHKVVEKLIQIRNNGVLTMSDYNFIVNIKESIDLGFDYELVEAKEFNALSKLKNKIAKNPPVVDLKKLSAKLGYAKDSEKLRVKQLALGESGGFRIIGHVNDKEYTTMEHHNASQIHKNNPHISSDEAHAIHKHLSSDDFLSSRSNRYDHSSRAKYGQHKVSVDNRKLVEDIYQDPQAATQTVFDGANNTNDTSISVVRKQLSKSARMIKALYKSKGMKEDLNDWEKEDKSVTSPSKKAKMQAVGISSKSKAAAIMTGGTTLTGTKRDDIEIDPVMKQRPGANPDKMNQQNQQKV